MDRKLIQSPGVFEITDYTTATNWERFTANLEEILTQWNLNKQSAKQNKFQELPPGFISSGIWREERDSLIFNDTKFDIRYLYLDLSQLAPQVNVESSEVVETKTPSLSPHSDFQDTYDERSSRLPEDHEAQSSRSDETSEQCQILPETLKDIINTSNDFASKAHCLVRWYNLRRFILIIPRTDLIVSDTMYKLVLSAASVSLANIDCHVPAFVQIHDLKKNFYQGISEHKNIRTMYEMIAFRHKVKKYEYLSDLISMFREKVGCSLNDTITVSVRLNYCLDYFELFPKNYSGNSRQNLHDRPVSDISTGSRSNQSNRSKIMDLRGDASFEQVVDALQECTTNPIQILRYIHVAALWPPMSDKVIVDSNVHSDLEPNEAPIWTLRSVCRDSSNMWIVNQTNAMHQLLSSCVDYAYEELDAADIFEDCDRDSLKSKCLRLSYDLAVHPEVTLSEEPTDSMRKIIALLFHRAAEIKSSEDALDELVGNLKRKPSLNEIYCTFNQKHKPSVKEFIIRSMNSRPFCPISSPALPQRMFCTICDADFRLCGAFSELCN